jgi:hypothetical protein
MHRDVEFAGSPSRQYPRHAGAAAAMLHVKFSLNFKKNLTGFSARVCVNIWQHKEASVDSVESLGVLVFFCNHRLIETEDQATMV